MIPFDKKTWWLVFANCRFIRFGDTEQKVPKLQLSTKSIRFEWLKKKFTFVNGVNYIFAMAGPAVLVMHKKFAKTDISCSNMISRNHCY